MPGTGRSILAHDNAKIILVDEMMVFLESMTTESNLPNLFTLVVPLPGIFLFSN